MEGYGGAGRFTGQSRVSTVDSLPFTSTRFSYTAVARHDCIAWSVYLRLWYEVIG